MTRPLVVDADVMIDFLRGRGPAVAFVKAASGRILLSSIVVAEPYAGVRGDDEMVVLDEVISSHDTVAVTLEHARCAGYYRRQYGPSHGVGLVDAIVAATAECEGADLATLNVRHYPMIAGLQPPYVKA